jgi:hypothetical protein
MSFCQILFFAGRLQFKDRELENMFKGNAGFEVIGIGIGS